MNRLRPTKQNPRFYWWRSIKRLILQLVHACWLLPTASKTTEKLFNNKMNKSYLKLKKDVIRWHQFTRRTDAAFLSLGREINIGTLTVATLLCSYAQTAGAQSVNGVSQSDERSITTKELEVTASRVALPMNQTARIVNVITREQIEECPAQSVNDLLKYVSGVDVRQRGAFGVQTDISINGGTHDQIVLLLNGVNFSSPHTGHLAADFPINVDDIERIEILEGAASRVYGTSAFSGAINIVTKKGKEKSLNIGAQGGSFGTFGADASISLPTKSGKTHNEISGGYTQSDGGTDNSDFQKYKAFYQGGTSLREADIDWQLGFSGQNYGANTFYSGKYPNQYEENRRFSGALSAKTKGRIKLSPTIYWNRAMDHYQLIRDTHTGENFHMADVYGLSVNAQTTWALGTSAIGADIRNEGILSTSLGRPMEEKMYVDIPGHDGQYTKKDNRTNICYFVEHNVLLNRWTVNFGVMANMNTGLDYRYRLYPGVNVSYRPTDNLRLYAAWEMAQRMPTFTDLWYKSPTQEGNQGLKPEKTNDFNIGAQLRSKGVSAELKGFYRKNSSMIDWVLYPSDVENGYTTYHAANFKLDNMGYSVSAKLLVNELEGMGNSVLRSIGVDYSYINQDRHDDTEIYSSNYAMNYLRHKFVANADFKLAKGLTAQLSYRWQDRMGHFIKYTRYTDDEGKTQYTSRAKDYTPFGLLDLKINWSTPKYEIYLQGNNLTSYKYYDIESVRQPGFWFMTGAKIKLSL